MIAIDVMGNQTRTAEKIVAVHAGRRIGSQQTHRTLYFISSLPCAAKRLAGALRAHWTIENSLHWSLDLAFR